MMLGGGGGGDGEALGRIMAALPLQLGGGDMAAAMGELVAAQQQHQHQHHQHQKAEEGAGGKVSGGNPQWSQQETRDFISIRAELERDTTLSKRSNKTLWEAVAARMRERGHRRSPEQCKCKWKNLVNRYKGKETSDPENGRQCPFFDELHAVFTERARNMQRLLLESESSGPPAKKKVKRPSGDRSSEELSDDEEEEEEESDDDQRNPKGKRKKVDRALQPQSQRSTDHKSRAAGGILELLQEFMQQQQRMEMQWLEMMERRAQERRVFEQEWRQSMEKLERERLALEQAWREREERRRIREEARAEKRDALLTTLLNNLIRRGG